MIGIDEQKLRRIADAYRDYALSGLTIVNYQLSMDHADLAALVTMGPSARHIGSSSAVPAKGRRREKSNLAVVTSLGNRKKILVLHIELSDTRWHTVSRSA
jgi:hypothetical protein